MIPDRWARVASFIAGAVTFAVTVVQIADLSPALRWAIGGVALVSGVVAVRLFIRWRAYQNALDWVHRAPGNSKIPPEDYVFEPADTEAAFVEVCRASAATYGETTVPPLHRLKQWRSEYPQAVHAAYWEPAGKPERELAAYVTAWPLRPSVYEKLRHGTLRERDLSYRSIDGIHSGSSRAHWYVANIVVGRRHREGPVLGLLLRRAFDHWFRNGHLAPHLQLLALAYSKGGERLLRRFGFHLLEERTADGWPAFELEADTDQLLAQLDRRLHAPASRRVPSPGRAS